MKRATLFIIGLLTLPSCATTMIGDQEREYKVKPGQKLEISLETGGSVDIQGWDRKALTVDVDIWSKNSEDYKVDVHKTARGIAITSSYHGGGRDRSGDLHLRIQVPFKFDLDIESMGGSLRVDDVEGAIEGKTMGGDLNLSGLKGEIDLETMGGDISLKNSHLDGRVHTMGGDVEIEGFSGSAKVTTMGGDVVYDNNGDESHNQAIRISTMGGDIDLVAAPGGGTVKTMGGDIHIESAKDYINARTMGGDIEIDAIDGAVKATTMGGDVTIRMVGDPNIGERNVDIVSKGGDITLLVPGELSMDIDITLAYTRGSRGDYQIISDFDLTMEESEDWVSRFGSARKYIRGTGKTGDGKHSIQIETVNGNVVLKKN
ncbi:MAG: DUF4097 family beta strand repeat protein [Fidelibacterota bacterium]|nr:MAG: DUF4097 family beta strand repeat protein [Candidatus Neomarinimicrobiota bacterium]